MRRRTHYPKIGTPLHITLLTGGGDKHYALGLASALVSQGILLDFIGSDEVNGPELHCTPNVRFLNLRGDQRHDASYFQKVLRLLKYYLRLLKYSLRTKPKVFHILWNNKIEYFDRTFLLLYYKLTGKRVVFTAHNVNAGRRDANDSVLNRLTLRVQYRLLDHIFVHTSKMRDELAAEFAVPESKVSVIPFGINNQVPNTVMTSRQARQKLCLEGNDKVMLFFGSITPYKGVEILVEAFKNLCKKCLDYRMVIAGQPKGDGGYWASVERTIMDSCVHERIIRRIGFIPDEEAEVYFKAADVLVLPYTHIFQSGVLFMSYAFGLPVIAADVGSFREDIIEGESGFLFQKKEAGDLARVIDKYFESMLYRDLERARREIKKNASERYSWKKVAETTVQVYWNHS